VVLAGRPIRLVQVASRTPKPSVDLHGARFTTDIADVIGANDIDCVVELIGGESVALELSQRALDSGKSLVTGNKALLALHGDDLFRRARASGASIGLEAAVAGGIPLINTLVSGLGGNQIDWVAGIINGTCNYILTAMTEDGADFADVLKTAQELGYAEADPTFDVGGIDAAHKIAIIAALVFGVPVNFSDVPVTGIDSVGSEDIEYARRLGYRIKHLGVAAGERDPAGTLIAMDVRAHAALIPEDALLAGVNGVTNAAMVKDNAVGLSLYAGPGAGGSPTAASVVADLIRVAQGAPQEGISIESVIQREQAVRRSSPTAAPTAAKDAGSSWVPIVLLTQRVAEGAVRRALATISDSPEVVGDIVSIRVETLSDA